MAAGERQALSETSPNDGAGPANLFVRPLFWLVSAALLGGAVVYGPLFMAPSHQDLSLQSENFFFQPNEAAGAPVLLLAAWLFYRRSHYLDVLNGRGSLLPGSIVVAAALGLYGWGAWVDAPDIQLVSVMPLLFGTALLLGGVAAVRAFWVPILFLGFALPVPPVPLSAAIFPIQLLTADFAGLLLNLIGVKSSVFGDQILRPENTFIVIETCSGVRSIVTLTMLTILLIDLFERRGAYAAILLLLAPLVAFLSNGIRVVTLVLNPHSSVHSIHNLQGIVMLLVGLSLMYVLDLALERLLGDRAAGAVSAEADESIAPPASNSGQVRALGVVVVALLAMFVGGRAITPYAAPTGIAERVEPFLERVFGEALGPVIPPDYQFRGSLRYFDHVDRVVRFEGESMAIFLGVAAEQVREYTMLSKRTAWPSSGWIPVEERSVELPGVDVPVRRVLFKRGGRRMLSYAFDLRAGGLAREWFRQAAALDRSPWHRAEHMIAIRIATRVHRADEDARDAEARIERLWAKLAPELDGFAPFDPSDS